MGVEEAEGYQKESNGRIEVWPQAGSWSQGPSAATDSEQARITKKPSERAFTETYSPHNHAFHYGILPSWRRR